MANTKIRVTANTTQIPLPEAGDLLIKACNDVYIVTDCSEYEGLNAVALTDGITTEIEVGTLSDYALLKAGTFSIDINPGK